MPGVREGVEEGTGVGEERGEANEATRARYDAWAKGQGKA
jgi:hypothetical protein